MTFIFLDESGDLGFSKKSSKFFIITVIATSDKRRLEIIVKKVHSQLRKTKKRVSGGILHAHKEKPITRKKLLALISKQKCSIMYIILNKNKVYTHLKDEKHLLYNYVVNILLDRIMTRKLLGEGEEVILVAAKRETNEFLNLNFKNYLESQLKSKHKITISVEIASPTNQKSLQCADFASWACYRKYESGELDYYNLIKNVIFEENSLFK